MSIFYNPALYTSASPPPLVTLYFNSPVLNRLTVLEQDQRLTSFIEGHIEKEDWTFATADTRYMTHGFHSYPARMIPQVAGKLIDKYRPDNKHACIDPYCGSGTVLVECRIRGIDSIGVDANPLAALIAKVKATPLDPEMLQKYWTVMREGISKQLLHKQSVELPKIRNLDFWFKPSVSQSLVVIRDIISKIEEPGVRDFFRVCFSVAVRKSSNTRPGEFKLFRIAPDKLPSHNPDASAIFAKVVISNIRLMNDFYQAATPDAKVTVVNGDTRQLLNLRPDTIHGECAELLVTSPPYGDSHTTVAYGQFSRYSAAWLGFPEEQVWNVDKVALGGKVFKEMKDLESKTLTETVNKIAEADEYRAKETYAFFKDVDDCFVQISKVMKKGKSHICYVLGNRTVKRIRVPADLILVELGNKYGFKHVETLHRHIPNKHMPSQNAPENVSDLKGETMSKENIVIWQY